MPKRNLVESGMAPQDEMRNQQADSKAEKGAHQDVVKKQKTQDEIDAEHLFRELNADLRKRKEKYKEYLVAVKKGEREVDPNVVEPKGFDKNSAKYEAWQQKADMVWFESSDEQKQDRILDLSRQKLEEVRNKLTELEKESDDQSLSDEYTKNIGKEAMLSASIRAMEKIRKEKESLETRRGVLDNTVDQLGDNNPALVKGRAGLTAEGKVADTQSEAIVGLLASEIKSDVSNDDSPIPVPVDYYSDSMILDPSVLEEINEEFNKSETQQIHPETLKKLEAVGSGRGVKKIRGYFDSYLERDAAQGATARDIVLTKKLEEVVGDDEFFADLLLKDDNFKKAVKNFFDVEITAGLSISKMKEKAVLLNWILDVASNTYKNLKKGVEEFNPEEITEVGDEQEQDSVGQSVVETPAVIFDETKVSPEASEQEVKSAFLSAFIFLRQSIDARKKDLAVQQSDLKTAKFFDFKKKAQINNEINYNIKEVGALFNRLKDLGNQIRDRREILKNQPDKNFDKIKLYSILVDQIDILTSDVKSKKEKPGSVGFFEKYSKAIALGSLLFAVGSEGGRVAQKPDQKTAAVRLDTDGSKLQSVMPKIDRDMGGMSQATVDKFGQTFAEEMSVEPKVESWGGSSEEPVVETGYSPADMVVTSEEESKPAARFGKAGKSEKHREKIKISVDSEDMNKSEDQLDAEIQNLKDQIAQKIDDIKPVDLDNPDSLKESKIVDNEIKQLKTVLGAKVQTREDKRLARISDTIKKEPKVLEAAPMVKMASFDRAADYSSLDFSREYVGKLGSAHDIVKEIQELAPVANASQRANFAKKAKSAIVQAEMFMDQKGITKGELQEAENVRKVAGDQYRALMDSLPADSDVVNLAERVKGDIEEMTRISSGLVGGSPEGTQVLNVLEKMPLMVANILATKEIGQKGKVELRQFKADLNYLLKGKKITSSERKIASELSQSVDVLLRGVPKSDKLWNIPSSSSLSRAGEIALERNVNQRASGK